MTLKEFIKVLLILESIAFFGMALYFLATLYSGDPFPLDVLWKAPFWVLLIWSFYGGVINPLIDWLGED